MKIEITIEVDDVRHPPPGAHWDTNDHYGADHAKTIARHFEKEHYLYEAVKVVADGSVLLDWTSGRATPEQIKQMRRQVVEEAIDGAAPNEVFKERLGEDYRTILEEYEAGAPWVKKVTGSVRASKRRRIKQQEKANEVNAQRQATKEEIAAFAREIARDEEIQQRVIESQSGTRVPRRRIVEMVNARLSGRADFDPRPTTPDEEKVWGRISRACVMQTNIQLPPRFYGHIDDGRGGNLTLTFDF